MAPSFKKEFSEHRVLIISFLISSSVLVAFLIFQYFGLKALSLDIKWVIISGIPILLGLFMGGYIKRFKGFGLEIELNLTAPLTFGLISKIEMTESPGMDKDTFEKVIKASKAEKNSINRLRFVCGRTGYYIPEIIREHYKILGKLEFIEITDQWGEFQYLIPASRLVINKSFDIGLASRLIYAIEQKKFGELFPDALSDYALMNDSILEAYKKVSSSGQSAKLFPGNVFLPVLDEKRKMIGIVEKHKLEARIAEEVLKKME